MVSAIADFVRLRAPGQGLYSSGDVLFSDAIFGRDSIAVAQALLHIQPVVAEEVIHALARLQGVVEAPIGPHSSEEEPGKIHHEHRALFIGARRISATSEALLRDLGARWGGDETGFTYYGSVDATPLFVRLIVDYCHSYGDSILASTTTHRDGSTITVRESLRAAMDWITRRIDSSDVGMVEFHRRNPDGIPFQVWKDSGTSYIHSDGRLANWDAPIAAIEVQAYAYDALVGAGSLLGVAEWRDRAEGLQRRVLDRLWMPDKDYFAMGLDRDTGGAPGWVDSIASNGALVLDTSLLYGLPDSDRYVSGLVRRICAADFVTEAGIRCRPVSEVSLVDFQDYHGVWTVWPKETFDVVRGLERHGLHRAARQVGNRLLNAVNVAKADVEFLYVSPDGRVMYDFRGVDKREGSREEVVGTNRPEAPQAWTVGAVMALKWWFGAGRPLHSHFARGFEGEREALDVEVVAGMRDVEALEVRADVQRAYERRGDFELNLDLGRARDKRARAARRGSEVPEHETRLGDFGNA